MRPADTAPWDAAPWSSARAGDIAPTTEQPTEPGADAADTGELPTVSAAPGDSGHDDSGHDDAVPDSPAAGADTVLDDGPAAPVSGDAPEEAPPTPAAQSDGTGSAAERTDDDSSTAQ
jgi:1,4-alpha-glucan branching enzyme